MTDTKENESLVSKLDEYFETLLSESSATISGDDGSPPNSDIGFLDRLKLFQAGVQWVAVKHKIDPEGEDDEFSRARKAALDGGTRRGGGRAASQANGST